MGIFPPTTLAEAENSPAAAAPDTATLAEVRDSIVSIDGRDPFWRAQSTQMVA